MSPWMAWREEPAPPGEHTNIQSLCSSGQTKHASLLYSSSAFPCYLLKSKTFTNTQCKIYNLDRTKQLLHASNLVSGCCHYLVLLSWSSASQNNQPPSPVLHVVQEVQLAWLNQERFEGRFC